jgi:hypothetical protein
VVLRLPGSPAFAQKAVFKAQTEKKVSEKGAQRKLRGTGGRRRGGLPLR